jgi:hypothetical protein
MSEAAKRLVALGENYAASEALCRLASDASFDPTTSCASATDTCSFPSTPPAAGDEKQAPSQAQPFPSANQLQQSQVFATIVQVGQ